MATEELLEPSEEMAVIADIAGALRPVPPYWIEEYPT